MRLIKLALLWLSMANGLLLDRAFAEGDVQVLSDARAALARGDTATAGQKYGAIKPSSPLFQDRLIDSMRWQFLQENYQEAWRITELGRRMGLSLQDLDYYQALFATKHGTCALGFEVEDQQKRRLLHAYMYRFYNRFHGGNYSARPYDLADRGIQQQHLIKDQVQYLADIPNTTLLKRKGCRFFYGRFSARKTALEYEFAVLNVFREQHLTLPPEQRYSIDDVEVRMIELAYDQKDSDAVQKLLERYKLYDASQWVLLEDQRRQFLWQKLIDQEFYLPPPYDKTSAHFPEVVEIVRTRPPDEGLQWLGLINWYDLTSETRAELVDHLLEAKNLNYRPFLLTAKTELLYEKGDMLEALGLVRRLLLLGESNGDPDIERRVTYIAGQIFVEYAYSEKILGAVQNAVPAGRWNAVFRMVLLKHAVAGNLRGFRLILRVMEDAGKKNQMQLDPEQMKLVTALAERNFSEFHAVLQRWSAARRPKSGALKILTDLVPSLLPLSDQEFSRIKSFTDRAAEFLKKYLMQGEQQVRIQDLLLVYDRARASEWSKGGVSVGASAVPAGHVDLRDDQPLAAPFTWNPPHRLPLTDLLLKPDEAGTRGWTLQ